MRAHKKAELVSQQSCAPRVISNVETVRKTQRNVKQTTACIFRVNEVIVFDDVGVATARETKRSYEQDAEGNGSATVRSSSLQLALLNEMH